MAGSAKSTKRDENSGLIRTMLIVQLALAGLPVRKIRAIVGCDTNEVVKVTKHLSMKGRKEANR